LKTLARKTAAIAQGDFTATVPETGAREVAHLARSFNEMGRQLTEYIEKRDFIRDTFGRYVTQEVVKRLLESKESLELGGETREVSIVMSDLRGFTAITADMDPEQVITFLNRYLGKMIEILVEHRAVIDEIIGDGILAFFGAPEPLEDHPARALACALAMQAAMDEINAANEVDGLPHLEMGIAVNTGAVVVGNIGSEKRMKYSVVGAHVNFTGRMESYTVGGQVLISPSTYARVKEVIEVRDTLEVQMKGVPRPATLYDVRAITGDFEVRLKDRREALVALPQKLPVHLYRISEKIIRGVVESAWITQLCDTAAQVVFEGELKEWEDIRLHLLNEAGEEIPGKIYAKVTGLKAAEGGGQQTIIRFTSVSPETFKIIRRAVGEGG
jgi:class 3 adenylate cyclase